MRIDTMIFTLIGGMIYIHMTRRVKMYNNKGSNDEV